MKLGETFETNSQAKDRLGLGIIGMIPAALVGGVGGAIMSLVAGIFGAHASVKKAQGKPELPNEIEKIVSTNDEVNKRHSALKEQGEKYACMSNEECLRYFEEYRKKYPMTISGDYIFEPHYAISYPTGISKIAKAIIDGKEDKLCTSGIIYQDLVRKMEEARQNGYDSCWIRLYYMEYGKMKEFYLYDVKGNEIYYYPNKVVRSR